MSSHPYLHQERRPHGVERASLSRKDLPPESLTSSSGLSNDRPPDPAKAASVKAVAAKEVSLAGSAEDDRVIDDRLIDASLAGDSLAFGQLVDRYQDRLRNTLRGLTGSMEEAEDVAQEAFVQAYLKLDSFQRTARFFTWLYRIAFNLAVSKSRKKRPRVSFNAVQEAGAPDPVSAVEAPYQASLADERAAMLHDAIATLPDDYRQVLVLREFEGCDYQRIAEVLEMPIGTVRSRLFRARTQLRERLEPLL